MKVLYSETFPSYLEQDTLYVSHTYNTSQHMCASGCGMRVTLPLGRGGWKIVDDTRLTVRPSVHVQTCNSHYWIEYGGIRWARTMSESDAVSYSQYDQMLYNREIKSKSLLYRIWHTIKQIFSR
jgi:hypothetical protein